MKTYSENPLSIFYYDHNNLVFVKADSYSEKVQQWAEERE